MKYRKKPVVVYAWQWLFNDQQEEVPHWVTNALFRWPANNSINFEPEYPDGPRISIKTQEGGDTHIIPGEWLIKGVRGEIYPCEPGIFEETYERYQEESA